MRILIAIDRTSHSGLTLDLGADLAHQAGGRVTLLTVVPVSTDRAAAYGFLDGVHRRLASDTLAIDTRVRVGSPASEIIRETAHGRYDLVVVGQAPPRSRLSRLLAATAVRVVKGADCPVVVVKGKVTPIQRLLLCDSGAKDPSVVARFTTLLAGLLDGRIEVTVLHVMSQMSAGPGVRGKQLRADVQELMAEHTPEGELLRRDVQLLKGMRIDPAPRVRHGLVVEEVLQEVQTGNYDLVVIGAHRQVGSGISWTIWDSRS